MKKGQKTQKKKTWIDRDKSWRIGFFGSSGGTSGFGLQTWTVPTRSGRLASVISSLSDLSFKVKEQLLNLMLCRLIFRVCSRCECRLAKFRVPLAVSPSEIEWSFDVEANRHAHSGFALSVHKEGLALRDCSNRQCGSGASCCFHSWGKDFTFGSGCTVDLVNKENWKAPTFSLSTKGCCVPPKRGLFLAVHNTPFFWRYTTPPGLVQQTTPYLVCLCFH